MRKILKPAYYQNYCIDSNQGLHNTEDCLVLIVAGQIRHQQIQDGGRPPFWKSEIAILRNRLTVFDEIWRGDAY